MCMRGGMDQAVAFAGNRQPCLLELSNVWIEELRNDKTVALVATQNCRGFVALTFLAAGHDGSRLEWFRWRDGRDVRATQDALASWLEWGRADVLVTVETPARSPLFTEISDDPALREALPAVIAAQSLFVLSAEKHVQGTTLRVWRRL